MYREFKVTVETSDYYVTAEVEVEYEKVDDSFDHEFGTKNQSYFDPVEVLIFSARNAETGEKIRDVPRDLEELIKTEAFKIGRNF